MIYHIVSWVMCLGQGEMAMSKKKCSSAHSSSVLHGLIFNPDGALWDHMWYWISKKNWQHCNQTP